jgi:hypothetical protein
VRDEFSRYLLELRRVPNARSQTVRKSFENLFERHGLPEAIRSDNGAPFASRTAALGGWHWESIWNEAVLAIPKITQPTSGCIATSAESWNA